MTDPTKKPRLLFCLPTMALSGGVKIIFEIAERLASVGYPVDIFSYAGDPKWRPLHVNIIPQKNLSDIPYQDYDIVFVSNAFFVPLVAPLAGTTRLAWFCQDYESFHHARSKRFEEFLTDDPTFMEIYRIPIPIVTVSRAVQGLIRERIGRESFYVPVGFNKEIFRPQQFANPANACKRVLLVGNYLSPYKGMPDGINTLSILYEKLDVELVLATQEKRGRAIFDDLPYPVEIHYCPRERDIPGIMATCDVYCCTSWYEGLGLPGLEAFHIGLPVVSTRDYGVSEYGADNVNLLLASPNSPVDLAEKLERVLTDKALANKLRDGGFATVEGRYDWERSLAAMEEAVEAIMSEKDTPTVDPRKMEDLAQRLEADGHLTPIEIFRRFDVLAYILTETCNRAVEAGNISPHDAEKLKGLSDELQEYTQNPNAEYYEAFKAKLDLTRLLRGLAGMPNAGEAIRKIRDRRIDEQSRTTTTLCEITYSDP